MAGLTWLHLSDWHQRGKDFNRQVVRDALLEDLRHRANISRDLARVDFLVFSGDIAFSGQKEEYDAAIEYLFKPVLEVLNLSPDHLFLVPGNHDLDRKQFDLLPNALLHPFTSEEIVQDWLTDERKRWRLLEPFESYQHFVSTYTRQEQSAYTATQRFQVDGTQIALLGLNSALMCGRNSDAKGAVNDYGYLVVGEPQVHDALRQIADAEVRIAVLHHPFEWLADFDRIRVEEQLGHNCHFILCGHEHFPKINILRGTSGNCVIIPAGASYDRRLASDPRYINAYNFVYLDFETRQGTVYLRRWNDRQSKWQADTDSNTDGLFRFDLPSSLTTKPSPPPIQPTLPKEDLREAPDVSIFYGRKEELTELEKWIVEDKCRLVAILGMGGIGKTTLGSKLIHQIKDQFDYVIWRSLRNAPPVEAILTDFIQFLSDQQYDSFPTSLDEGMRLLIDCLKKKKCLLILDNVEEIMQSDSNSDRYGDGYDGYKQFIQGIGNILHQSCLLLTSREKPDEFVLLEGPRTGTRSLRLTGLQIPEGRKILDDKGLIGSDSVWKLFIDQYSGNPLALKLVSEYIHGLYQGDLALFLEEEPAIAGIDKLLDKQIHRLSEMERGVLYWLAIEREPISLDDLRKNIIRPEPEEALPNALVALQRRSMIESIGKRFTLQPVIMQYIIRNLVKQVFEEIENEKIAFLESYSLIKALTKDYIRDSQIRLILKPLSTRLLSKYGRESIEKKLKSLLSLMRMMSPQQSGYAAGNVLNLLVQIGSDLCKYDFSYLTVRQAYLYGLALREMNFAHANLATSVFTNTFGDILSVAYSHDGEYILAGTTTGELRIWQGLDGQPLRTCFGHTNGVRSVAFSSDQTIFASGSDDQTIRIWRIHDGSHVRTFEGHTSGVRSIDFSPDGSILASGSDDRTIRLWKVSTGKCLSLLEGHQDRIMAVAFSPDGKYLASGGADNNILLWEISTGKCLNTLTGHTNWVRSITFSPDGRYIATGSDDYKVCIWDISSERCLHILKGHTSKVRSVAFSPNENILASASEDQTVRIWHVDSGQCLRTLLGHSSLVRSVAFSPNGQFLTSGGDDHSIRIWEVSTGYCLRTLQGYTYGVRSVVFSPHSHVLISGSADQAVRIWDVDTGQCLRTLTGHSNTVRWVDIDAQGQLLASGSTDQSIRIWRVSTGQCLNLLQGHTNRVRSVAFSPNGNVLASGSDDHTVRLWDVSTGNCSYALEGHTGVVRLVAFSPDGKTLASGASDHTIRLWEVSTGKCLHTLVGHTGGVRSIAFSPDGKTLASGASDHTIRLWEVSTGKCPHTLEKHTNWVRSVAFSPNGQYLASGSNDSTICLWEVDPGRYLYTLQGHTRRVRSVAFNHNGNVLASGSDDQTVLLWDVHSDFGRILYTLSGHTEGVRLVVFSADGASGDILASGSDDGTVILWDALKGEPLNKLRGERLYERMNITKVKGLTVAQKNTLRALGSIEDEEIP